MASNHFWRNTRLEKHIDYPLNTNPPVPLPAPPVPRSIVCSACGCEIARSGEIVKTGDIYKGFLKHEQTIEGKDREIAAQAAEIAALKSEITAFKAAQSSSGGSSSHRPGGRVAANS